MQKKNKQHLTLWFEVTNDYVIQTRIEPNLAITIIDSILHDFTLCNRLLSRQIVRDVSENSLDRDQQKNTVLTKKKVLNSKKKKRYYIIFSVLASEQNVLVLHQNIIM